ncbi:hypothetical protein YC2023_080670 [Brassica napus]
MFDRSNGMSNSINTNHPKFTRLRLPTLINKRDKEILHTNAKFIEAPCGDDFLIHGAFHNIPGSNPFSWTCVTGRKLTQYPAPSYGYTPVPPYCFNRPGCRP